MQHTDKATAEFEEWYRDKYPMAERMIQAGSGVWMTHRDDMKECWLASRRELVVIIEPGDCFSPNDCGDLAIWRDDAKRMLEAAGVPVRG